MNTTAVERMRRSATAAVRARFYASHRARLLAARVRPRALVLVYHRIAHSKVDPFGQAVAPANFARHLSMLRSRYEVIDVPALLADLHGRGLRDGTVVVTFDDGYADVLENGVPAAAAQEVPLLLFVTVAPILAGGRFWWDELAAALAVNSEVRELHVDGETLSLDGDDARAAAYKLLHARLKRVPADARQSQLEVILHDLPEREEGDFGRPLTADELKVFAATPGLAVGAHTVSHPSLGALAEAEQRRELVESRRSLEKLIGRRVDTLAYPFGKEPDVGAETRTLAAEAGYAAAFTSVARPVTPRSDLYALPRLSVHDWTDRELAQRLHEIFGF